MINRQLLHPDLARFPAHLHLNIQASHRGRGIGKALLEGYLDQLRSEQVKGVHLKTIAENTTACALYENLALP